MDLVVFENNKPFVIDEFREGRFDYVELASDVAETKFFQFLFGQQIVEKLAEHYPSPRERHHVPMWMYLSSQLSLRLHGQHSFHSYPLIIRAGGLIDALGPDVAHRQVDRESGNLTIHCSGFNERNLHPRQTPCDQDFLRKLARDTNPEELEDWYNRRVAPSTRNSGPSTPTACLWAMAPICSCPTTRVMKARNGCYSTSTTIPSARNKSKR